MPHNTAGHADVNKGGYLRLPVYPYLRIQSAKGMPDRESSAGQKPEKLREKSRMRKRTSPGLSGID